jgi:chromosome segregation ATPase
MGFSISLISVVINTFIISYINNRVKEIDSESSTLSESLIKQALELNSADIKHDLARMMRYFAAATPDAQKADAKNESAYLLNAFLQRNYAAETNVPPVELIKSEIEEMNGEMSNLEKHKDINKRMEKTTDPDAMDKLIVEMSALDTKTEPTTELGKRMQALKKYSLAAFESKSDFDYWLTLLPVLKESKESILNNINTKQQRIKELKAKKETLNKAEKEAKKAEEEARQSEIEAAEAKARAKQANIEADQAEAKAEERIEAADEAIDEAMARADAARDEASKLLAEDEEEDDEKAVKV